MQLLIFSLEYFISGAPILIWVFLILQLLHAPVVAQGTESYLIAALIPLIYLWGMLADFLMSKFLSGYKQRIEKQVYGEEGEPKGLKALEAKLWVQAPELAKIAQWRSTRDRIARGFIANVAVTMLVCLVIIHFTDQPIMDKPRLVAITLVMGGLLIAGLVAMWRKYQERSIVFSMDALEALDEMHELAQSHAAKT